MKPGVLGTLSEAFERVQAAGSVEELHDAVLHVAVVAVDALSTFPRLGVTLELPTCRERAELFLCACGDLVDAWQDQTGIVIDAEIAVHEVTERSTAEPKPHPTGEGAARAEPGLVGRSA